MKAQYGQTNGASTMKVMLRNKFSALSVCIKNLKCSHISHLVTHRKALEQQEDSIPRNSRWEETKLIRVEISETETVIKKNRHVLCMVIYMDLF